MIDTVLFDMDGVLVDSMPMHYAAWAHAFRESEKIALSEKEVYEREGEQGRITVRDILKQNQIRPTDAKIKRILALKEKAFKRILELVYIPGAEEAVRLLSEQNFSLGLVTGTPRSEVNRLLPADFRDLFDVVITGSDVSFGKPDPEPYRKALLKLKKAPEKCLVLENSPYGIRSAKSAGLFCIAISTSLPASYLSSANEVVASIEEAMKIISQKSVQV